MKAKITRSGPIRPARTALILTVAVLSAALAGCSTGGATTATKGGGVTTAQFVAGIGKAPNKALCDGRTYTFGYDTFSDTDSFETALYGGLEAYAKALGCVKINKLVDNANPQTAVQNASIFAQQKVDGVILFNVVQAASQGQQQALKAAKIPIVSLAVPVTGAPFITNDDSADGLQAGTALANSYKASGKSGAVYAIIGRYDGQDSTKQRMDGVVKGLQSVLPSVNILPIDTKSDPPTAQSATTAVLAKVPAGATILLSGVNDDVTYAMVQAVKQAGRTSDTLAMGIGGGNPAGLNYLCQNPEYVGVDGFFPENWPKSLVPALLAEANGKHVSEYPAKIVVPTTVLTRGNISKYYPNFACKS